MYEIQYAFSLANGHTLGHKDTLELDDLGCSEAEFAEKMVKEIMKKDYFYFKNPKQTGCIGININTLAGMEIEITEKEKET